MKYFAKYFVLVNKNSNFYEIVGSVRTCLENNASNSSFQPFSSFDANQL